MEKKKQYICCIKHLEYAAEHMAGTTLKLIAVPTGYSGMWCICDAPAQYFFKEVD